MICADIYEEDFNTRAVLDTRIRLPAVKGCVSDGIDNKNRNGAHIKRSYNSTHGEYILAKI